MWIVVERPSARLYKPYYQRTKRVLEIFACLISLPFLLPLFLLIALAIRWDSPGTVFFVQDRIGKGGRRFRIIKFRTMYQNINDAPHRSFMKAYIMGKIRAKTGQLITTPQLFKPFSANQVTKIGRFLRKTSLDELPQIFNVFKGEMSFVGPRPNVPWEVEAYQGWHMERLEVTPGITGLAQVRGRSTITFDDIVKADIEYIKKRSLWLDLKILWWTFVIALLGKGAL
jgi:lipopolysaccharide/colanic/teichoic acid biosynthesis glycosyltransferase